MSLRMLVMGVFAALIAATGSAAKLDDAAARAKALKAPVTLTFWQTHNAEETRTLKEIVGEFEKRYPMVRVAMDTVAFADAQTKFKTAAKAGTSPDVFRCEVAWTPEMAELGYLTPIDDYVTDADKAAYLAAPLKTATYRDEIWGLPQVTDCLALLTNRQMLKAAGIEPPKTMDELAASGAKLGDPEGKRHAFAYPATDSYFMLPFVWSFGGGLISDDGKQVLINNEGSVKGLQFMLDLRTRHKAVAPAFDVANDYNNQLEDFKNARVAMIFMGPWATANILGGPAFKDPANLGIAPLPAGPAGTGSPIGGHNYVMSAACANPDLAFLFMDFLNKPENQAKFVVRNNLLPTKKAAYELPEVKGNRIAQEYGALLEKARTRPLIPQAGGIFAPLTSAYQDALRGAKTARQALDTVATEWKRLLEN
jgi:arabinogalactan oligomer / maltooligosaccharide transport system substrate-binding protein